MIVWDGVMMVLMADEPRSRADLSGLQSRMEREDAQGLQDGRPEPGTEATVTLGEPTRTRSFPSGGPTDAQQARFASDAPGRPAVFRGPSGALRRGRDPQRAGARPERLDRPARR